MSKKSNQKNKTVTFTYQLYKEKNGYFVRCLNWNKIYTEGFSKHEAKKNALDLTVGYLEMYYNDELLKEDYPGFEKKYNATQNRFQLTFDKKTGKHIPEKEAVS